MVRYEVAQLEVETMHLTVTIGNGRAIIVPGETIVTLCFEDGSTRRAPLTEARGMLG